MSHRHLKAALLLALLLGSALLVFTPGVEAQTAPISFDMQVTDATVKLDVRPGADGIGCTQLDVTNTGTTTIDVQLTMIASGVVISPSGLTVTLNPGETRNIPVCALALTRSSYKNVQVRIDGNGKETSTQLGNVNKNTGFVAQITQFSRLSVRTETPFSQVRPGKQLPLQFTVKNDGNYVDDIAISVINQDKLEDNGFSISLANTLVNVDSQGEQPFTVGLQMPRGTLIGWFDEYHTVTVEVRTTLQGSTESRVMSATIWVRGVFLPGFDPIFTIMALGIVATALSRRSRD